MRHIARVLSLSAVVISTATLILGDEVLEETDVAAVHLISG